MRHPFETWPAEGRRALTVGLLVLVVGVSAGLLAIGEMLPGEGLVQLELATSHERVAEIVQPWIDEGEVHLAAFGLGLDMLYLVVYGALFTGLAAQVAARARRVGRAGLATLIVFGAWGVTAAALLDVVENTLQIPMLQDPSAGVPAAVAAVATTKFALLGAAFVSALVTLILTRASRVAARP